jgi:3-hydroxyacyl-[acyl-carrier-protein] dehydratase
MPPKAILSPDELPTTPILDLEGIRALNRQRFDMEHLTAVTLLDVERRLAVGYKDVSHNEFWVRGHMPGHPLMPGVLMCEAAAQLCSVYCGHFNMLSPDEFLGFGGMDDVRFRGSVLPGQRLWLVAHAEKNSARRLYVDTQGFVDGVMVFHARILGIAIRAATPGDSGS